MRACCALLCAAAVSVPLIPSAQSPTMPAVTVRLDRPGAPIPATMFGLFFEDINFAADGGLYPERVKNRSFEFPDPLMGWKKAVAREGSFIVLGDDPVSPKNAQYLRITNPADNAPFGVMNDGFRGVGVRQGDAYRVSLFARRRPGRSPSLRIEVQAVNGRSLGNAAVTRLSETWTLHEATFVAQATDARGRLAVLVEGAGSVDVDVLSVFPVDTWRDRPRGLRRDLVQLLADLRPGFLRFPGGCIVEGPYLDGRYRWKETIGDPAERRILVNRWNDEFLNRPAPDYYQSFGLGFFENFQLAEDLGAEPLPILNCGMACQFNSSELASLDRLDEYIQDALDLVEFANGAPTTTWGQRRVALGHPAPFNLTFVGIGNEQWGPDYIARYERFASVLKAKHPAVRLVSSAGPAPSGERFDYLWARLRELGADLVDEHYYQPPQWFLQNAGRYDAYPRTGPKVFAGEFAAHARGAGPERSTWEAALAETAFMTGLERNADIVEMASYAPLLAHVDAWQWAPNLIWFDNLRSYGTPSYAVQKLFGANRGSRVLPVSVEGAAAHSEAGLYASASLDEGSRRRS
jgi:alpha-L-arabinofuranosidase